MYGKSICTVRSPPKRSFFSSSPHHSSHPHSLLLRFSHALTRNLFLARALAAPSRSFGKGLIQGAYTLSDGSALVITVARYLTPLHNEIQVSGFGFRIGFFPSICPCVHVFPFPRPFLLCPPVSFHYVSFPFPRPFFPSPSLFPLCLFPIPLMSLSLSPYVAFPFPRPFLPSSLLLSTENEP
jgi:hypothetical protein